MYCAQFIFQAGDRDEDYFQLHQEISEFCANIEGFLGVERWIATEGNLRNSAYYFESLDGIQELAQFSGHQEAKSQYKRWYHGYQIVISEIVKTYGDDNIVTIAK
jgi:hypothetical protein